MPQAETPPNVQGLQELFKKKFVNLIYVTAGYPTPGDTVKCSAVLYWATPTLPLSIFCCMMATGCVDAVELGVPFTDPTGDGPQIAQACTPHCAFPAFPQAHHSLFLWDAGRLAAPAFIRMYPSTMCGQVALERGTVSLDQVMNMAREARAAGFTLPLILMGYLNTFTKGWAVQTADVISAAIIVDLPLEEWETPVYADAMLKDGVSFVPIITRLTTPERIAAVDAALTSSFIYCTSVIGVTGARPDVQGYWEDFRDSVFSKVRANTSHPVIIGFGIATKRAVEDVRNVVKADGLVIGSAFMRHLDTNTEEAGIVEYLRGAPDETVCGDYALAYGSLGSSQDVDALAEAAFSLCAFYAVYCASWQLRCVHLHQSVELFVLSLLDPAKLRVSAAPSLR
eukprot:gene4663-848_t